MLTLACSLEERRGVTLQLGTAGSCVRTSIACGGEVGVFYADAKTNELIDMRCTTFAADAATTLEKLPALLADSMPPLPPLPADRSIVVEVAAWSPSSGKGCPRFSPDVAGNAAVPSYFGRSGAVSATGATSVSVSLQCFPSACLPCAKFASPTGTDPADGGVADAGVTTPFKTASRLVASLAQGQVGCLEDGTYTENVTFSKGGSGANPITLAAAPGAHAVLRGVLTIPVTTGNIAIAGLTMEGPVPAPAPPDGGTAPPPKSAAVLVRGDHVALRGNDISNPGAACVVLGDTNFGPAKVTVIDTNRIHDCTIGVAGRRAESALIANNYIYDNTGDGIALMPSGSSFTIEHDLIDGNGSGVLFGSDGMVVSSGDVVRTSIISNSTVGFNVYSSYPGAPGTGNSATQNCLWNGKKGDVASPAKGFSAKDNTTADPLFVDRAGKDFSLGAGSPCAGRGPLR